MRTISAFAWLLGIKSVSRRTMEDWAFVTFNLVMKLYLMKLAWSIMECLNDLWENVIKAKYFNGHTSLVDDIHTRKSSSTWQGISKLWNQMVKGCCWSLGNGSLVYFWLDNWLGLDELLCDLAHAMISLNDREKRVSDYVIDSGQWNWSMFQHLPSIVVAYIASILPPNAINEEDTIFWRHSSSGKFTLKLAYKSLEGLN